MYVYSKNGFIFRAIYIYIHGNGEGIAIVLYTSEISGIFSSFSVSDERETSIFLDRLSP